MAVGGTVIICCTPLSNSVGVSIVIERGCQQNDSLADGAGQKDYAFLNCSLLESLSADPSAFRYKAHRTGVPTARYDWTPGVRLAIGKAVILLTLSLHRY